MPRRFRHVGGELPPPPEKVGTAVEGKVMGLGSGTEEVMPRGAVRGTNGTITMPSITRSPPTRRAVSKRGLLRRTRGTNRAIERAAEALANAQAAQNSLKSNLGFSATDSPAGETATVLKKMKNPEFKQSAKRSANAAPEPVNNTAMAGGRRRRRSSRKGRKASRRGRKGTRKN